MCIYNFPTMGPTIPQAATQYYFPLTDANKK